jgi:hypothetical protein
MWLTNPVNKSKPQYTEVNKTYNELLNEQNEKQRQNEPVNR